MFLVMGLTVLGGSCAYLYHCKQRKSPARIAILQSRISSGQRRKDYLKKLSSVDELKKNSKIQHTDNRHIVVASLTVLSAGIGTLSLPVFTWLSLGGIFYVGKRSIIDAYRLFVTKGTLGVDALSSLIKILLIAHAQILLCSISILIYAFNRKLMHAVKDNSKKKVIDAFRCFPKTVFVLEDAALDPQGQTEIEINLDDVAIGDIVVVKAGESIPVDGVVAFGQGLIDQHILNGETQPVEREAGQTVFAMTVLVAGRIGIRTQRTGEQTTAAQITQALNKTVEYKTDMQLWVESATDKTIAPTILLGAVLSPWIGMANAAAFMYSHPKYKTTLVCSISLLTTLNEASSHGILIRDGRTLELMSDIDTVVFDKTGTLTTEQPQLLSIHTNIGYDEDTVLQLATAAEHRQTHPIAQAIIQAATSRGLIIPESEKPEYHLGLGLTVQYQGKILRVGSLRFIAEQASPDDALWMEQQQKRQTGHTSIAVALDNQVIGIIELDVQIRPESPTVIHGLRQRGIRHIYIISGDQEAPTARLAEQLGIDDYYAEVLPEQKADIVEKLQQEGRSVCFVGDGINDSIALKKAQVSISLTGASTIAIDSAQVILMDKTLNQLCPFFDLARSSQRNIKSSVATVTVPHVLSAATALSAVFQNAFAPAMAITLLGLFGGVATALRTKSTTAALIQGETTQSDAYSLPETSTSSLLTRS